MNMSSMRVLFRSLYKQPECSIGRREGNVLGQGQEALVAMFTRCVTPKRVLVFCVLRVVLGRATSVRIVRICASARSASSEMVSGALNVTDAVVLEPFFLSETAHNTWRKRARTAPTRLVSNHVVRVSHNGASTHFV